MVGTLSGNFRGPSKDKETKEPGRKPKRKILLLRTLLPDLEPRSITEGVFPVIPATTRFEEVKIEHVLVESSITHDVPVKTRDMGSRGRDEGNIGATTSVQSGKIKRADGKEAGNGTNRGKKR